jgi:hypothetical protein
MVKKNNPKEKPLDIVTLLSLPDQLRKTALAILKLGRATATMVARDTGREKTIESKYLTQLVKMGFLKLEKQGHDVYFYV